MIKPAMLCLFAGVGLGQLRPTVPEPTNVDLSQGAIGEIPPGWNMPPAVLDAGYRAELRQQDCGWRFSICVAYVPPRVIGAVRAAELAQTFPADPYIGKSIRFSAWLRLEKGSDGGYVHIRMRVDYASGKVDMRDSVPPPVTGAEWQQREVYGHVDPGAVSISIWARYVPSGSAWVASPSFGVVEEAKAPATPSSFGVATASFPVSDAIGQTVRYSGWIKTENVTKGYAGLWWRVDGAQQGQVLAFDNTLTRLIGGMPASGNGIIRGATGTTGWTWYEIDLPVASGAHNINFGLLFGGTGTAWFDALSVELNGVPYINPQFDFDFELPAPKGFSYAADNMGSNRYKVGIDNTTAYTGRQSLKMQFLGDRTEPAAAPRLIGAALTPLDPATVDDASRSVEHSTSLSINFINRSSTAVDIYWIDYDGNRVLYRPALAVGASWQTGTFLTHPWLVVASGSGATKQRDTGVRLAGFEATSSGGDAIITDRR
jgi:hypothetical protein